MSTKVHHSGQRSTEKKTNSQMTSSNTAHQTSRRSPRHQIPVAKIVVPMLPAVSGSCTPRGRSHHPAKEKKNASPVSAVDTGASSGGPLPQSAAWMETEVTNCDLDLKVPSAPLPVASTSLPRSQSTGGTEVVHHRASSGFTALDEKVMERLQSLAEEGADDGTQKNGLLSCDVRCKATAVCCLIAVVMFTTVVVLLLHRWSFGPRKLERRNSCATAGCQQIAAEILTRLNHSVNPCDDIQAHVCGPIRWESDLVFDTATDMMRQWQKRGAAYLESKRKPLAAFAMYEACMDARSETVSELKQFMRERHLSWPEYGSRSRHALSVLLDLLINWGVPFWFEISLRCLPNETRQSLHINRVKMNKWRRQQQISEDQNRLTQYAMQFYDIFDASQDARARIPRLLTMEKEIHAIIEPSEKQFVQTSLKPCWSY